MQMRDFPNVKIEMLKAGDETMFSLHAMSGIATTGAVVAVQEWCRDQFEWPEGTMVHSTAFHATFLLRDPVNATAFRMRWC